MSARSRVIRGQSCTVCYQRKVKCDGKRPCSTCVKTGRLSDCRDTKLRDSTVTQANRDLLMRLRRYEALLEANGVPLDAQPASTTTTAPSTDVSDSTLREDIASDDGKMIIQSGNPRFVESAIWSHIEFELAQHLPNPTEEEESELASAASVSPDALLFGTYEPAVPLETLHPNTSQILQLWQIFLADFYPLVMPFHAPSIQQIISESIANLANVSSKTGALLFSIYLSAVASMTNQDCLLLMGEPKEILVARYSKATQQSLTDAQFLQSNDLTILQALTVYLLASRQYIHSQSLWILSGVATRLAQTMGLHREYGLKHLSPYDGEVRRRLWWQIIALNHRSAQLSGSTSHTFLGESFDTKRPLNVHDSDLSPFMSELPPENDGPTDMLFCTVRLAVGDCVRRLKIIERKTPNPVEALAQKEKAIDQVESQVERIVSRCDTSIPIHLLTMLLSRSAIGQKRLSTRHEANQKKEAAEVSTQENDALFQMGIQIMVYDHLTFSTASLRSYLWHVESYFPFQVLIFLLHELIRRQPSADTTKAWTRVLEAYEDHAEMLEDVKNPLHFAVGNLTLRAWDSRMASTDPEVRADMAMHPVIVKLQTQRLGKSTSSQPKHPQAPYMGMMANGGAIVPQYGMEPDEISYLLSGVDMQWPGWQYGMAGDS